VAGAQRQRVSTLEQLERMRSLFMARQRGALWENFARLWQDTPAEGGEKARAALGLDERPVVLLATNVLGDSLTLGRQVFRKAWPNGFRARCSISLAGQMSVCHPRAPG
jgi:hypothetical protein